MSNPRLQRVNREIADCSRDAESEIQIALVDGTANCVGCGADSQTTRFT